MFIRILRLVAVLFLHQMSLLDILFVALIRFTKLTLVIIRLTLAMLIIIPHQLQIESDLFGALLLHPHTFTIVQLLKSHVFNLFENRHMSIQSFLRVKAATGQNKENHCKHSYDGLERLVHGILKEFGLCLNICQFYTVKVLIVMFTYLTHGYALFDIYVVVIKAIQALLSNFRSYLTLTFKDCQTDQQNNFIIHS